MDITLLTEQERLVYIKLYGAIQAKFDDTDKVEVKRIRREKLKPYNLVVTYTCNLCGSVWEQYFKMEWSDQYDALISTPVEDKPIAYVTRRMSQGKCKYCRAYLESKTKEELINLII